MGKWRFWECVGEEATSFLGCRCLAVNTITRPGMSCSGKTGHKGKGLDIVSLFFLNTCQYDRKVQKAVLVTHNKNNLTYE